MTRGRPSQLGLAASLVVRTGGTSTANSRPAPDAQGCRYRAQCRAYARRVDETRTVTPETVRPLFCGKYRQASGWPRSVLP